MGLEKSHRNIYTAFEWAAFKYFAFLYQFINNNRKMSYQKSNHYVVFNKHVSFGSEPLKITVSRKEKIFVIMF